MSIPNIISGFRSTGIYPYNRDVFTDSDFAAAVVSERADPEQPVSASATIPEPEPQPGPSGTNTASPRVTPSDILPCPTYIRKVSNRGRKKRKSAIITDTPEKDAIEKEKSNNPVKRKQLPMTKRKLTSKVVPDSSSDDEPEPILSDHSSDHVVDESVDESADQAVDEPEEDPIDSTDLVVGTFVMVQYATKRSKYFYVAQIEGICGIEYQIDCMKRVGNSNRFSRPDIKDIDYIEIERVVRILTPSVDGLTRRAIGGFVFDIDVNNMAIR